MKKMYNEPKLELILFGSDIITTSTKSADITGKDTTTSFNG